MPIKSVIDQLGDKTRGVFTSPKELFMMISALADILPEWLAVNKLPAGTFVRQRKPIESYRLREIIYGHFEQR